MTAILNNFNLKKQSNYKFVALLNMPKIGLNNPPMAPALLQAIAQEMGCTTHFQDINLSFQRWFKDDHIVLNDWCELREPFNNETDQKLIEFADSLDLESVFSADVIGISVFSTHSVEYTNWFLNRYRSQIKGKIVIGGAGVNINNYGQQCYKAGLVDYYVINEGEQAWRAILGNSLPYPGVNSDGIGLSNFDSVPVPNYNGYSLDQYFNSQVYGITIGVEGSRGCVRNCTFCDIRSFWDKYKFKDGVALAKELIELKEKFSVQHFFFNDSLVNGSDKAFRAFIQTIAEYNKTQTDPIAWSGYYIVKPAGTYKPNDWINLKNSGVKSLYIGIESGSESVRDHMKKKFSNSDIDDAMKNIQFHGIRCTWLMIIGYPSETEEDFQMTLDLLKRYQPMAVDRTIDTVALGMTMGILDDSPLANLKEELHIVSSIGDVDNGIYWQNENGDFKTRIRRRIEAEELIRTLGYNSWVGDNDVIAYFEKKLDEIEKGIVQVDDFSDHHG